MNNKSKEFLSKIETGSVIVLLISSDILNIPSSLNIIINLISYGIVFLLVGRQWKRVAYVLTKEKLLLVLVGFACFSFFWSATPSETFTQIRALVRTTLFAAYLTTRYTMRQQMNLLSWTIALIAIISTIICIVNPSYGISITNNVTTWQGIYAHKQYLGRSMGLGASLFLINIFSQQQKRWVNIPFFLLTFSLIVLSTSRTSLLVLLLPILLFPLYKVAKKQSTVRIVFILTILLVSIGTASIVISNLETIVVDILGKDIEFNGRIPLWTLVIEKISERPLLGYGYAGFWMSDAGGYIIKNTWAAFDELTSQGKFHAHNGFLEITLELGLIGLTLLIIDMFFVLQRIIKLLISTQTVESFWMLVYMGIVLTVNLSEAKTFLSTSSIFWILQASIAFSSALEYSRMRRNSHLVLGEANMAG